MLHISCPSNQASEPSVPTVAFLCPTSSDAVTVVYTCSISWLAPFISPAHATKESLTTLFLYSRTLGGSWLPLGLSRLFKLNPKFV